MSWMQSHLRDAYVRKAHQEGYRSRAAYKLKAIDDKDRLLQPGKVVVDLGASPGGWSQYAVQRVGPEGYVIALDRLPMAPIPGVLFLQEDFTEETALKRLQEALEGKAVDLVLSDMAPNMTGMRSVDQPRSIHLAELALDFARRSLAPGGDFLVKVFQGEGFDGLRRELARDFKKVVIRKPQASRSKSREMYVLARNRFDI
ncbi:MAG: RlmE family RNA methyltransferase [Gammaproteobacteria bacterium]|nr:MAG: RlmE family RNA methyltransferase [Gammaproteobacteria bacterium]